MRELSTDKLRKEFLEFFAAEGHKIIPSDSLIPADDPTVLFTSAGMNQFKRQFIGKDITFRRAATCQRCLRTGDLDKVGKSSYHHTFFEMLGNFSFGDYFKEEAISFAWEFLIKVLKIPEEKLWVSVYKNDKEAASIWHKKIGIPLKKIKYFSDRENFWPSQAPIKGPNGPCGPCSEIFFNKVELWNLVFTQFNRVDKGVLKPLPFKNIDTGMGLERMSSVLQNKKSNFDIDIFMPIIDSLVKEIRLKKNSIDKSLQSVSCKIVADHIRAVVFAINDGVVPSNEERGYVIRKLIRRCVLQYRSMGMLQPLLYKVVSAVSDVMKVPYPEILGRRENISQIIKNEETSFLEILDKQLPNVKKEFKEFKNIKSKKNRDRDLAKTAFEFYDTYGVPYEILEEEAKKQGVKLDKRLFDSLLSSQRQRSQAESKMKGDIFKSGLDLAVKKTEFVGYEFTKIESAILKIIKQGKVVDKIDGKEEADIVLDRTVFYPESGGQVADTGFIKKSDGSSIQILDVKTIDNVILHRAKVSQGEFKVGDKVNCYVDEERRFLIASNHTATHLLQSALRKVLGEHVRQSGSLVDGNRLRFDFTHFSKLSRSQLMRIEEVVNDYIRLNTPLNTEIMELSQAKDKGALAFFGEKYQEQVRVVSIDDYSKELCGGTHLKSTGQIGIFKIVSESAVSQGIRRIEAVTSRRAYELFKQKEHMLSDVAEILKVPEETVIDKAQSIIKELNALHKKFNNLRLEEFKKSLPDLIKQTKQKDSFKIFTQKFSDIDQSILRVMVDLSLKEIGSGLVCLVSRCEDKVFLVLGITKDLVNKGLNASVLIRDIAAVVGGSGGGRADFAQAGGTDCSKIDEALLEASQLLNKF